MYRFNPVTSVSQNASLDDLLTRVGSGIEEGLLPVEVFCDDTVFRAEMDRIFASNWVFVAHESEIPNTGDYVLRKLGLDSVIVARDDSGQVNVLLNHCRHRATEVCHTDRGNTRHFKCPYHGWMYDLKGEFSGAPSLADAYGKLDRKEWGLKRAPKVESFHGFVFASLADDAPTLRDYLGDAAWALEGILTLHPKGLRLIAPPERFQVRADWKNGAENFAGDGYHVNTAHVSNALTGFIPELRDVLPLGVSYLFGNGHTFIGHRMTAVSPDLEFWGYAPEYREQFDLSRFDAAQIDMLRNAPPTVGNIFPNLSFLRFPQPFAPDVDRRVPFTTFRQWQPVAPGVMEIWSFAFEYAFTQDDAPRESYQAVQYAFGSGGVFEQDDTAAWEGIPKMSRSPWARKVGVQLHYQQLETPPDPNWKGKGQMIPTIFGEYVQKEFWKRWLKDMSVPATPSNKE